MSVSEMPASTAPAGPRKTSPRPFIEIPSLWVKVTQMSEEFMAAEAPRASALTIFISMVIYAVITAIVIVLAALIGRGGAVGGTVMASLLLGLIIGPVCFCLNNGLDYVGARSLGGTGDFVPQAYLISLFYVPLGVLIDLLTVIPTVGPFLVIVPFVSMFLLNVRAIRVVHRLSPGKAIGAVLWPVVLVVLVCCGVLLLIGPTVDNIVSNIVRNP